MDVRMTKIGQTLRCRTCGRPIYPKSLYYHHRDRRVTHVNFRCARPQEGTPPGRA